MAKAKIAYPRKLIFYSYLCFYKICCPYHISQKMNYNPSYNLYFLELKKVKVQQQRHIL
jgi:hypothetical protein